MDSVKRLLLTIIMVLFVHTAQAETLNDEGFGSGTLNAGVVSANLTSLVVGNSTGSSYFDNSGTLQFNGTATVWDDLRVDLNTIGLVPGTTKPDKEIFKNGTYTYSFDASSNESVIFSVQIPHNYKTESKIEPHIHWSPSNTDTGNLIWKLEYTIATPGGTFGNSQSIFSNVTASGTTLKHEMSDFTPITMTGNNISTMLICNLSRMGGDTADTFTGEAKALEFDIHYEIDTVGSRTNVTK